ncbi:hypothetical protein ACPPVO_47550 [Dactylosporangium sp. McL0621]|uniref:hypothetical protein n=1 Tax=Dactylosporangium sp. McL0621 TaxID=3415678 RepID=UPI003CF46142
MTLPTTAAVRRFKAVLHGLYDDAGRPGFTAVAGHARSVAGQFGAGRSPGRAAVAAMLRGDSGMPSEEYAVVVGAALARVAGRDPLEAGEAVRAAWRHAYLAARTLRDQRPGVGIGDADPLALAVRRVPGTAHLPAYVRRPHDDHATGIVDAARAGASRIMTLVGPPGCGRARTLWEAVRTLPGLWRIWRPTDDPTAAGPYTVVWLPDAATLLHPQTGPDLVAAVRALVEDPDRAPVLVALKLWPQDWNRFTTSPLPGDADPYAAARALLHGTDVVVPDAFTATQVAVARASQDQVLRDAADAAAGRITQTLAGLPALLDRYAQAPPPARAILEAVVDARRFGGPVRIPGTFLRAIAGDSPFAVDYATGAGLLVADASAADLGPGYVLDEAVYHAGTLARAAMFPAAAFWDALTATVTDPAVLHAVAEHAQRRGRPARAVQLYRSAVELGDMAAMVHLSPLLERTGDRRGADALAIRAAELGDGTALARLAAQADEHADTARVDALVRAAADTGDPDLLYTLARRHLGTGRAETLYREAAGRGSAAAAAELAVTAHAPGDLADVERYARQAAAGGDTTALRRLAGLHRHAGDRRSAERFAVAAASAGHTFERHLLREEQRRHGKAAAVTAVLRRLGDDVDAGTVRRVEACLSLSVTRAGAMVLRLACRRHTGPLRALCTDRHRRGDMAGALRLAVIASRCGDPSALADLAVLTAPADWEAAVRVAERAATLGDSTGLRRLARVRRRTGDPAEALRLLERAAADGDPDALFDLARTLHQAGDTAAAELRYRAAARGGVADAAHAAAQLLQGTDPAAAARYAQRAVQLGHPTAVRDLGQARERADDLPAAAALYRWAADRGDDTAGQLLARLWHCHHPAAEAAELAVEAAEHGNPALLRHLADRHAAAGHPVRAEALYWAAYEHGDSQAMLHLPHLRAEDDGDQARADDLALQAAQQGRHQAVTDLAAVRALTGDLAAAERLCLRAAAAGQPVDVRPVIRLRLATDEPLPAAVAALYEQAGAHLVLAWQDLRAGRRDDALARCVRAANLGDPDAVPQLVRVHRRLGDHVTADMIDRYGLSDDGGAATAW